jgi:hypothetical protein
MKYLIKPGWILILILLLTNSCKKEGAGCFQGAGKTVVEDRPAAGFTTIELQDNINLSLSHSNSNNSVQVESGKNLIKGIKTEISGGVLTIRNENWCNWMRSFDVPLNVHVSVGKLDSLVYRGSGDITCMNHLQNDSIKIDVWEGAGSIQLKLSNEKTKLIVHQGTVDLTISGSSWVGILASNGYGFLDCQALNTQYTYLGTTSPNHCYVNAQQYLSVEINNIGDVYYSGDPRTVDLQTSSTGELIKYGK